MQSLTKQKQLIIWIFSLLSGLVQAQDIDLVIPFAQSLQEKQNYSDAIVEYNRAVFLGAEDQGMLFKNIADCYFNLGSFTLAEAFYDKAYFSSDNDSIRNEIILSKAYSQLLHADFLFAKSELYSIETVYNTDQHKRFLFLTAFSEFGSENFDISRKLFGSLALMKDSTTLEQVEMQFDKFLKYAHSRRPGKVEIMSYILPGSGQCYVGEWKEGINSFVLIGGLLYGLYRFGSLYAPIDGLLLFGPWVQRYYQGGAEKANKLAQRSIQTKKNEAFNQLIELCLDD